MIDGPRCRAQVGVHPMFKVGQKVACVDDSLPANPWHRQYPLVKNQIYFVCSIEGPYCISIDSSGRAWQNYRFRPLVENKTDTSFTAGADPDSERWDNRVKVPTSASSQNRGTQ